ncbi:hypothetical protein BH20ACT2_BH20ACT2_18780 [soil metagenome]
MLASIRLILGERPLGEGNIDNYIIDPLVHRTMGMVVLVAMVGTAGWLTKLALARRPIDTTGRVALAVAQLALAGQALLGIKLLDQGMGVVQLYIHYIGGLTPLGLFLGAGWVAWQRPEQRTRALAVLTWVGLLSAAMAFFIGQAYVNR